MNISMNNVFQAKIVDGDKEKKQDLFSWRMSTGRNFVADDFQWNNINSSIRANMNRKLNLDFSMTHDWYDFDEQKNMRINKFKTSGGMPTPRLINARFSISSGTATALRALTFRFAITFRFAGRISPNRASSRISTWFSFSAFLTNLAFACLPTTSKLTV